MERKKIPQGWFTIVTGCYADDEYESTFSLQELNKLVQECIEKENQRLVGRYGSVEWRVNVVDNELLLFAYVEETEEDWRKRIDLIARDNEECCEAERKKLKELMKKYPDMLESKQ